MNDLKKQVEKLKREGETLYGVTIVQFGEDRHISVDVHTAQYKDKKWSSMSSRERKDFEDLLYLSNVQKGNPKIYYV